MSKYTTEVRFICEQLSGIGTDKSINEYIEASADKVFDFDFPMFDEGYRKTLETKILKHYYTREIGLETVELWKHWLDMRMNEIMPYYNQLYKSATYEFNPLYDVDFTTTSNRKTDRNEKEDNTSTRTDKSTSETNGASNIETSGSNSGKTVQSGNEAHADKTEVVDTSTDYKLYSDTPQNGLSGVDSEDYLTNAQKDKHSGNSSTDNSGNSSNTAETSTSGNDNSSQNSTNKINTENNETTSSNGNTNRAIANVDDYIEHVVGKRNGVSYSSMILEYRKTLLNIDTMIIDSLSDLFMNVW